MTVLPIRHFPQNPVLRQKAKKISVIDGSVQRLIDDTIQTTVARLKYRAEDIITRIERPEERQR